MIGIRAVAVVVIVMMIALAANIAAFDSFDHGAGFDIFLSGSGSPWQLFINQDLVAGLWLAVAWIIYRQGGMRVIDTAAWVWMVIWWGNIVVAAYVLVAMRQAGGESHRFFAGARAGPLAPVWPTPSVVVRVLLLAGAAATIAFLSSVLARTGDTVTIIGSLLGYAPIALSLILLAFPARTGAGKTA